MGFIRQKGVTFADPDRVENTFIIYTGADAKTVLINLNGSLVQSWKYPGMPARVLDPKLNGGRKGHVLLQLSETDDTRAGIYANRTIGQLNWHGKRQWEWGSKVLDGAVRQNHDWQLLENGNWLVLGTKLRAIPILGRDIVGDQSIFEVNTHGEIIWTWSSGDHIQELGLSERGLNTWREAFLRDPSDPWGPLEMNSASTLGQNRWYDKNPEKNSAFHPDNIIISFRKVNVIAIIERSTGHLVWKLGPYFDEAPGDEHKRILKHDVPRPVDQISGQHNPHFIPKDLPGAGNILLFDCQGAAGFPPAALGKYSGSRILEINPVTKEIVWQYTAEDSGLPPWTFFSSFVSNAQRLKNGNTLITEGMQGRLFQVTAKGEVVWEYYSPSTGSGAPGNPGSPHSLSKSEGRIWDTPLVYRSQAVAKDWLPDSVKYVPVKKVTAQDFPASTMSSAIEKVQPNKRKTIAAIIRGFLRW